MTVDSVRGAGKARAGATDTTMLIWKAIKANPGITRDELWAKVEHGIPEGYALRLYAAELKAIERRTGRGPNGSGPRLTQARGYVLTHTLGHMRKRGTVIRVDGCYSALKQPRYRGNPEAIDVDGSKAAEHMAVAEALRRVERLLAQPSARVKYGRNNVDAMWTLVKWVRAKGSTD